MGARTYRMRVTHGLLTGLFTAGASAAGRPAPGTRPCVAARWCPAPPWRMPVPPPRGGRQRRAPGAQRTQEYILCG